MKKIVSLLILTTALFAEAKPLDTYKACGMLGFSTETKGLVFMDIRGEGHRAQIPVLVGSDDLIAKIRDLFMAEDGMTLKPDALKNPILIQATFLKDTPRTLQIKREELLDADIISRGEATEYLIDFATVEICK